MKKTLQLSLLGLLVIFCLALVSCSGGGGGDVAPVAQVFIDDLGGREVRIFETNYYPPFCFIDENDKPAGWDYDVWDEICERLNCEAVQVESAWPPFEMLMAGELDVAAQGITVRLDRAMLIDYSDPYLQFGQTMLMRTDSPWTTAEEFAADDSARIGSSAGSTNESISITLVGKDRVDNYGEYPIAVEALLNGDVDGVALDAVNAAEFVRQHPGDLVTGFPLTSGGELLAFIYPPGSPLIGPVNVALQDMMNDGTMDEICQKWFFRNCTPEVE